MNALLDAMKSDKNSLSPFTKLECGEVEAPVITRGLGCLARHCRDKAILTTSAVPVVERGARTLSGTFAIALFRNLISLSGVVGGERNGFNLQGSNAGNKLD
jgi:hypothetical protein